MKSASAKDFIPSKKETYIRARVGWDDYEEALAHSKKLGITFSKYVYAAIKYYNYEMKRDKKAG